VVELPANSASAPSSASSAPRPAQKLPPKPAAAMSCVPPYYYEKGIKRFKAECL
jgi:hypothetical protein